MREHQYESMQSLKSGDSNNINLHTVAGVVKGKVYRLPLGSRENGSEKLAFSEKLK